MPRRYKHWVSIEELDDLKDDLALLVLHESKRLPGVRHLDVRFEIEEGFFIVAEDVTLKSYQKDFSVNYGVRIIAGPPAGRRTGGQRGGASANGFIGGSIGAADFKNAPRIIRGAIAMAYDRARANARRKLVTKSRFPHLGKSIQPEVALARIPVIRDTVEAHYGIDPRTVSKTEAEEYVLDVAGDIKKRFPEIKNSFIDAFSSLDRQLFVSSEGSVVDEAHAVTGSTVFFTALSGSKLPADLYHHVGNQLGWEALTEGKNVYGKTLGGFAAMIGDEVVKLSKARPAPTTQKPVVIVTDPDFNGLLAHEIIGHPSELDRAMKWETGYAGRSWFLRSFSENQVGKQVASPLLSAFSDPTLSGAYGHYLYDDEGTPASRVYHIRHGVYKEFMNSRETAAIWGSVPNGHYKANSASAIPLIRMSVSAIEGGNSDPSRIIKDVERGYYVVGHRIPSISESREHFRLACRLMYEIRDGKIGELYRDGSISGHSKDFFMSIDAVGNDFKIFPIPNCGKGQPMQSKMVGNGGPTMRGRARIVGPSRAKITNPKSQIPNKLQ